ncbi:hypothetical protein M8Z33_17525 [Streptomyces sp. ZAF1911]|uniref:hypothetical protein n=1 Tax=Streptomyces sp. ZAF1911 TaxID=2944129 RepID=UPI00237C0A84|nr:hypothetical protein [Streptomyces sp. ZAF1911]MDD9378422.1 hypothetical protein [Streptomyces sp. ZAF1911]
MRTALRTSIVTAALAGALLAPAATAIAAPAAQAVTAVTSTSVLSGNPSTDDRYDGETVLVAKGRIAVLRNAAEGPEVWIRAVSPDWKPGDGWAGRVLAKLDPTHKRAVIEGIEYDLRKVEAGQDKNRYGLNVHVLGEGASNGWYLLPKATPATKPAPKPTTKPAEQSVAKPAAKPQTAVVPKGPVAAGAELTDGSDATDDAEASESTQTAAADTDDTTTAATGAALIAIFAGLGTTLAVRARKARARG